jgi:hypothetical protein
MKKIIIFLLFPPILINALIINIPGDQPTIQEGINVAVDGDTVLVHPGTYVEDINYNGKNIAVASLFYVTQDSSYISQTIIDGDQNGSVVTFINGEDSTAVLCGFTITNGSGKYSYAGGMNYYNGGGIYCDSSSPTLRNLIIKGNFLLDHLGVFYARGGGIFIIGDFNSKITNTVITDNIAHSGGGICFSSISTGIIPVLTNVTITNNFADAGGGIYLSNYVENVVCINSILWNNSPEEICFYEYGGNSSITISYSIVEGGELGIVTNNIGTIYWLEGNIDSDPLFINPVEGDFHLQDTSPCIGAGIDEIEINGTWYYAPLFDIEGNPRPDPAGSMPDMGAYENPLGEPQVGITQNQLPSTDYQLTNYPNPFNPSTTITFNLTAENTKDAEIDIYNIKGQKVKQLSAFRGQQSVIWNGTDENNEPVSSGIYFYQLRVDGTSVAMKKCLLLK